MVRADADEEVEALELTADAPPIASLDASNRPHVPADAATSADQSADTPTTPVGHAAPDTTPGNPSGLAAQPHDWIDTYVAFLFRYRILLAVALVIIIGVCIPFAMTILDKIAFAAPAPPGTRAFEDKSAVDKLFPGLAVGSSLVVFAETTRESILTSAYQQVCAQFNHTVMTSQYAPNIKGVQWYYTLAQLSPKMATATYVAASGRAALTAVTLKTEAITIASKDTAKFMQDTLTALGAQLDPQSTFTVLGLGAIAPVAAQSSEEDFVTVDGIALPIALLVFGFLVGSLAGLLIPIAAMISSAVVTLALMSLIATYVDMPSFVPSLMMTMLVALNVDYSLFLLTRLREEAGSDQAKLRVVATILRTAGRTAAVSGLTLAFCFLGLLILPLQMLRMVGGGSSIAVFFCMAAAWFQTPLLLLLFPKFFRAVVEQPDTADTNTQPQKRRFNCPMSCAAFISSGEGTGVVPVDASQERGMWARLGRYLVKQPCAIALILVVVGVTMPINLRAFDYRVDDLVSGALPRNAPVTQAIIHMNSQFGAGMTSPYMITLQPLNSTEPVMSQPFFDKMHTVIHRMSRLPHTDESNFLSVPWLGAANQTISAAFAATCSPRPQDYPTNPANAGLCMLVRSLSASLVNADRTAAAIQLMTTFDASSAEGREWLPAARAVLATAATDLRLKVYLTGGATQNMDAMELVYESFPMMITVTTVVVLLFFGLSFRSVTVPLRAVITIALTLVFVFGSAVYVFREQGLNAMGWDNLSGHGSIHWMVPIISFSLLVGVALDYDAFLLVRIHEAYMSGMSTSDAIVFGLSKTGHIITAAGGIMTIAFGGLIFSAAPALNQLAFYLVGAVIYDTVIIRSLLVPAIMTLLGEANWWPMHIKRSSRVLPNP